jgi:hypothetical protein
MDSITDAIDYLIVIEGDVSLSRILADEVQTAPISLADLEKVVAASRSGNTHVILSPTSRASTARFASPNLNPAYCRSRWFSWTLFRPSTQPVIVTWIIIGLPREKSWASVFCRCSPRLCVCLRGSSPGVLPAVCPTRLPSLEAPEDPRNLYRDRRCAAHSK